MWMHEPEMARKWYNEHGHAKGFKKKKKKSFCNNWYKTADTSTLSISGANTNELLQYLTIQLGIPEKFIMQDHKGIRLIAEDPEDAKNKIKMKFPNIFIVDLDALKVELQSIGFYKFAMNENILMIDFDNTIAKDAFPSIGKPIEGVKDALQALKDNGYIINIYTCRTNALGKDSTPEEEKAKIEKWMKENDIPYDKVYMGRSGKPFAGHYIDDKAVEFDGDWEEVLSKILGEK